LILVDPAQFWSQQRSP